MVFSTHQDRFANFRGKKKFLKFKLIAAGKQKEAQAIGVQTPSRVLDTVRKSAAVRPTEHGLQTDKDASFC